MSAACAKCGSGPVRIMVGSDYLCEEHRLEWLAEEAAEEMPRQPVLRPPSWVPGPWELRNIGTYRDEFAIGSPRVGKHHTLARVLKIENDRRTTIATGRLMAAAPDLLQAIQHWLFYLELDPSGGSHLTEEAMLKQMRLAVAKATGIGAIDLPETEQ